MTRNIRIPESRTAAPTDAALPSADLQALIDGILADTAPTFAAMDWADQEITAARRRHPGHGDALYHAFQILLPRDIGPGMGTEFVYRGHARELLERVAAGSDLRPATAAEISLALVETSLRAPMHGPAAGLYFRMWQLAFPDNALTREHAEHQVHYEHLHGPRIDELEADLRRKLRDPDRHVGVINCAGRHHGQPVDCAFASR